VQPFLASAGTLAAGTLLPVAIGTLVGLQNPSWVTLVTLFGTSYAAAFMTARARFRAFVKRRVRILTKLMDLLSDHVVKTAAPALPAAVTEPDADRTT